MTNEHSASSQRIVLAGGSGFLGQGLARALAQRGCECIVLTRNPSTARAARELRWDGKSPGEWQHALEGARAVVNLTGRSVNCRHTTANRREIIDSRVDSVLALGDALRQCAKPPPVLVQAGSLAIYGDRGEEWCDETAAAGDGFSVEVCKAWENSVAEAVPNHIRRVIVRIGFVLGRDGGALGTLAALTRWGLGGRAGSGRQFISWIHHRDMNRIFIDAIDNPTRSGVFNATGPGPVANAEFMRELRRAMRRPWSPPVPAWAVHVGAKLMGTEASLALTGRRCSPKRLLEAGFTFEFPSLPGALNEIFRVHHINRSKV